MNESAQKGFEKWLLSKDMRILFGMKFKKANQT